MNDPLDLRSKNWLAPLLWAYLETYDSERAKALVLEAAEQYPDSPFDEQAHRLALRRLEGVGLRPSRLAISPALAEKIGAEAMARDELEAIGLLTTQWDILQDIAWLHRGHTAEGPIEVLTVMALGLEDYKLAGELHHVTEPGELQGIAPWARRIEKRLSKKGELPSSQAALSIGMGLAFIESRVLARIASLYFERAAVEEEGTRQLHALSASEKVDLVEILIALAWADGHLAKEEKDLVEQQIAMAELEKGTSGRLKKMLANPPKGRPEIKPLEDAGTRRFILEQAILLSLVDDDQAEEELTLLREVAGQLGGSPEELEALMVEVSAWYERNREMIRDLGPVSGSLGRLRRLVLDRAQDAVRSNMRKIVQEIRETGELAKLLGAASIRDLSPEESVKVRAQLLDICKTVPALAIFLLPGGGLLLPVLIKLLPFNILPTAFGDAPVALAEVEPGPAPPPADAGPPASDSEDPKTPPPTRKYS